MVMRFMVSTLALLLAALPTAARPDGPASPALALTATQATADVALVRRAYETVHPGLYRYTDKPTMDAAFDRLAAFATTAPTNVQLYGEIARMLATMHCDHTKPEYPASIDGYLATHATHMPVRFRFFKGRMIVASSDPDQARLARGTEIVAINGVSVAEIVRALTPFVSYDGGTSAVVPAKLEADADLTGSDFEQFYPIVYGFPSSFVLDVRDRAAEKLRRVSFAPVSFKAWTKLAWPAIAYHSDLANGTSWRMLPGKVAYLRVDSFVNYRSPVDAMLFYQSYFKSINESGATKLIVDLRWNGGGSTDATIALARFLSNERFVWNAPIRVKTLDFGDLPQYAQTWGDASAIFHPNSRSYRALAGGGYEMIPGRMRSDQDAEMLPMDVAPDRFRGPVTILTSLRNASGSTMVISKLHDIGRVRLVGEPTGGSATGPTAGYILFLKLPNSGITVRVPDMWNRMAVTHATEGASIVPDVPVAETFDDFLSGRDAALEAARSGAN